MFVHAVFASYFGCFGPMVYFLESAECLVDHAFYVRAGPHHAPFLFALINFSVAIVFHSISNQWNIAIVVEFEIQLFVLGLVRTNCHWVDVRPEEHVALAKLAVHCRSLHLALFEGFVELAGLAYMLL